MSLQAEDYSYVGQGSLYLPEHGAAAPLVQLGNVSALNFQPAEEQKKQPDYTTNGGGTRNSFSKLTGVTMSYSFTDFSPENFKRALRSAVTAVSAGTTIDEQVVAYKGGFTPLAKVPSAITAVRPAGGTTPYSPGTDYEMVDGGIYIPSTSTITDPVSGAANIEVDYSHAAQSRVETLVDAAKNYEMVFVGLNQARSGLAVRIQAHKVSHGLLADFAALGEEYASGQVSGEVLYDASKSGGGISKYAKTDIDQ